MPSLENLFLDTILSTNALLVALLYITLSGFYLIVAPAGIYFYLNSRWYVASSVERLFMYFLMFFFFPGVLLFSPFLNFRPKRRKVRA